MEPEPFPGPLDLGDKVPDLLYAVHLLSQVFRLQKVAQMGVSLVRRYLVDVEKTLVNL